METDSFGTVIGAVVLCALIFGGTVCYNNANEAQKCKSLNDQGVKAVMASGCLGNDCIVLQRNLQVDKVEGE